MLEFIIANNVLVELILAFGVMVITILGSSKKESQKKFFLFLAIILLVISGFLVTESYSLGKVISLSGFFITNHYIVFSKVIIIIFSIISLLVAMGYVKKKTLFRPSEYSILVLLSVLGMFVLMSANDLISMYCGMELYAICLYVLVSCDRDNLKSSEAGMKYFIVNVIASILLLYGISLVFGFTGTTNFSILVDQVYSKYALGVQIPIGLYIGMTIMIVSICIKIAVVPFHFWVPDVYQGAPLPITAFLSTVPKIALILFFIRFFYTVLYPWAEEFNFILKGLIILSLLIGALGALKQRDIKRLLAYSTIFHVGFMLIGIVSGSTLGINASIKYLFIYAVMNLGLFAFISVLQKVDGEENFDLSIFQGLSKEHPVMAFSLVVLLLSMAGFPPLAGFLAKFYIIIGAMNAGLYGIVAISLIFSIISTYYYLRIIKMMYLDNVVDGNINYVFSTENVIVTTFATVFNLILIISPAGLNSLISTVTSNLLK